MQSRRVELGVLVSLVVAVIGAAVYIGNLNGRVSSLESGTTIEEARKKAIADIVSAAQDVSLYRRIERLEASQIVYEYGRLHWWEKDHPQLSNTGTMSKVIDRVEFTNEFLSAPKVMVAPRYWNWEGGKIAINIVIRPDKTGFTYELHAFHDTLLYELAIDWIAIAEGAPR